MPTQNEVKKTGTFRSLTVTLAVAFFALTVIVLLIAISLDTYFSLQAQQKLIIHKQQSTAENAASTVKNFIQERFSVLKAAARIGDLVIAPKEEQKLVLGKLLNLDPAFRQLLLLNAQEQELLRVSRISEVLSAQSMKYNQNELHSKVSQREVYISPVYIDEITSEPMVVIAVPITDVFGEFQGVLAAEVNLKFMWELVGGIKIGNNGLAYVVDSQGNLIAFADSSRVLKGENLIQLREVSEFVNNNGSSEGYWTYASKGIQGTDVIANYAPLGMPDWAVVVELPVLEAYDPVIQQLKITVLIVILNVGLAVVTGIYLSRRITEPLISLRNAAREIGKGKLGKRIDIKSKDELGELAQTFNQMSEDLAKLDKLKMKFIQDTAHELKTPLSVAITANDLLEKAHKQKERNLFSKLLRRNLLRLRDTIESVLELYKFEEGSRIFSKNMISLEDIVNKSIEEHAPVAEQKGIKLVKNIAELPEVYGEGPALRTVIENLIENAIKYTNKGSITITAKVENKKVVVSVEDTGLGIPLKEHNLVFTRFYKANPLAPGAGIGLALTKNIVEAHGGKIRFKSTPKVGSTFTFTLPAAKQK